MGDAFCSDWSLEETWDCNFLELSKLTTFFDPIRERFKMSDRIAGPESTKSIRSTADGLSSGFRNRNRGHGGLFVFFSLLFQWPFVLCSVGRCRNPSNDDERTRPILFNTITLLLISSGWFIKHNLLSFFQDLSRPHDSKNGWSRSANNNAWQSLRCVGPCRSLSE